MQLFFTFFGAIFVFGLFWVFVPRTAVVILTAVIFWHCPTFYPAVMSHTSLAVCLWICLIVGGVLSVITDIEYIVNRH